MYQSNFFKKKKIIKDDKTTNMFDQTYHLI